jgi:hypothetical protein
VRITKDITPFFITPPTTMKTSKKEEVEIKKYNTMLRPSLDAFIHCYKGLNFSLSEVFIKFLLFIDHIFSSDNLHVLKEQYVISKINKKAKKEKKLKIKKTVRSYKTAFNRFNKEPTLYETDKDGFRRRGEITLQKNRKK